MHGVGRNPWQAGGTRGCGPFSLPFSRLLSHVFYYRTGEAVARGRASRTKIRYIPTEEKIQPRQGG